MLADRSTQLIVVLDKDDEVFAQLCRTLSATHNFALRRCSSWRQAYAMFETDSVAAVMARGDLLDPPDGCTVPLVQLTDAQHVEALPEGVDDSIWIQVSASEMIRCLEYSIERHSLQTALDRAASYDPLTGSCNRQLLNDRLRQGLHRASRNKQPLAVLVIDLDNFRHVNDTLGHSAGDRIIRDVSERLRRVLRSTDTVGRMGSDEFGVVVEDYNDPGNLLLIAQKITNELAEPFNIDGESLLLGCSIGIASYPECGVTVDGLLLHAHMAMQQAKGQRGCNFHFYDDRVNLHASNLIEFEAALRLALRRNQFELHYQPRVDLRSGQIVGLEGLIRWRHPERGLLGPNEFIPLAEETGLIVPMGYWVMARACHDLNQLSRRGFADIHIAVNVSFRQFQDSQLLGNVRRVLRTTGIDPHRLEFELTETAIMQRSEQVLAAMQGITELGVRFSLDDFGTGYSSFVHLHSLPISLLKIDRSFVRKISEIEGDRKLVNAVVDMGHSLGLAVVAEGVEERSQLDALTAMGCDQVQGYFISPALPFEELCYFLDAYRMGREDDLLCRL
ncbi:bifunctional diguanylate cyclase/phosphodiesterase [Pseudomonas sp. gcc21]|uniref:putative bifunctional diguanylate cyclase/phosphodiesterase n=1 Tax=Pseudomonas sp. gcc21 TaxID=2726989 RepID=UPI0014527691|nr:bifunctional diguanylate cyclase/phosphodiesterase [Pseudomonas sp. gcc21]QJD59962.1 bifunctional diguanylate cyclase/phosphodiesterase [Pseudomonas sp. gcc21]